MKFCNWVGVPPIPATSEMLCFYAAYLARKLKYRSVKQYMNIVRIIHAECGLPNPCAADYHLTVTLRGIRRHLGDRVCRKEPVTPEILRGLLAGLNVTTPRGAAVWAAALLMFYGLLRRSNVMPPETGHDHTKHLTRGDLKFNRAGLSVSIRWSKTIQFQERVLEVPYPWDPASDLCPTQAVFNSIRLTPNADPGGPALLLCDAPFPKALTPRLFVQELRKALGVTGTEAAKYAGHSFRRGGACWAFQSGINIETIRQLGDWKSSAYTAYVLPSREGLAEATSRMLGTTT